MDKELETVIKILNTKTKYPLVQTYGKGFRIRQSRQSHTISNNPIKSKPKLLEKPAENNLNSREAEIEEDLITDIQDFYKEEDDQYKQEVSKTGAPVLWMRGNSKDQDHSISTLLKPKKYLIFRPYIDLMTTRPTINQESIYHFRMLNSDVKLIRFTLEDNGFKESLNNSNNWCIMWHGGPIKNAIYQSLTKYQKVNHFPRSHEITRKDLMYKNLAKMQVLHGARNFDFIPKTYIMPQDAGQLEYEMNLIDATWIVKPSASSQGKGIFLTNRFSEVPKKEHVVSQYIENPLLIDGLKFDLRIYVSITCFNPLRIYMYKEGLVRFATQKYNNTGKGSRFMFLTNYSVNKHSENFVENDNAMEDGKGSKWSITALRKLFSEQGIDDEKLWAKIKDLVIKTILSIESITYAGCEMHLPYRTNCFELLGFDVLIDDTLNPWLLEVNLSPSMNCDAPIDQKIKGEMISDLFTLTGVVSIGHRHNINNSTQNKALNYLAYMQKSNLVPNKSKKMSENQSRTNPETFSDLDIKEERAIIKETNDEYKRRGKFERIFPSELSANYKIFFERERVYNTLLFNYFGRIYRKGQGSSAMVYQKTYEDD